MNSAKSLLIVLVCLIVSSCGQKQESGDNRKLLLKRLDSLQTDLDVLKKQTFPRISVLMNNLGLHHSRLWEPGVKQNWKLSDYEFSKIKESLNDIIVLYGDSLNGNSTIGVEIADLMKEVDKLGNAIKAQSKDDFVSSYKSLTIKCNSCHQKAGFDFYEIIAPKSQAYTTDIE